MSMMQVSRKVDYALRAIIYLSVQRTDQPASVKEIAARRRVPQKFLEKIIKDLTRAGLVVPHRGSHGGYTLSRPAEQITFRDVIEAIEGPISLNVCVTEQRDCSVLASCNMQRIWQEGQRRMLEFFSDTTLADIRTLAVVNTNQGASV
ncbi:MAG: Rrf2 family transcriptional regulator [Deltaproteobacteria bacterium]|nr:Rrf2 family transcriptional regulator [Deltaproteobacteria bacterium]